LTPPERPAGPGEALGADHASGSERDVATSRWLARCRELAESDLDGIEAPADELVALAAGDREVMEQARHELLDALEHEPQDKTLQQMLAFWRRAFEKGDWSWQESPWDDNPLLS
jgi:uncharacterized protein HemY